MAKRSNQAINTLPRDTTITVIAIKGARVRKKNMPYGEALELLKVKKGWVFTLYQLGFCSIEANE